MKTLIFAFLLLGGCATTANYENILQSWVGQDADRLVASWGPPAQTYQMTSGKLLTFVSEQGAAGYTHYGQFTNMALTTYSSNYCKTTFEVDGLNTIRSWRWEGNTCRARAP